MKKILTYLFVFCLIGEVAIRLDKTFAVLEENRIVKISSDIEKTEELRLLENGKIDSKSTDNLKIMVLGDSYIHGGGISFKDNFSQQLKSLFKQNKHNYKNVWVLDVSRPSSNTLDNNLTYFEYVEKFNPDIVILGYNFNDIEGTLAKTKNLPENTLKKSLHGKGSQSFISKVYSIVKKSELIGFIMSKSHRSLNSIGIVIPGSKFDENLKIYYKNKLAWKQSKELITEIIDDSQKRSSKIIIYKFQEMSMNQEIMQKAYNTINSFFKNNQSNNTIFIDGDEVFSSENYKEYRLSKYDGHPNEKAHLKMANKIYSVINDKILKD